MSNVEIFDLHDSQLSKIELGEGYVELTFHLTDGNSVLAKLTGLTQMLCNHLREGNTVLEVAAINELSVFNPLLNKLFDLTEDEKKINPPYLVEIKKKLSNHQLTVFHVTPSYGGDLIALCEKVDLLIQR